LDLNRSFTAIWTTDVNLNVPLTFPNVATTSGAFPAKAHIGAIRFADILPTLCSTRPAFQSQKNKAVNT
jgi:hypothetical protein